ncbi:MAG: hypothetical protein HGA97_00985 [Chlorobiaceae bacterium]|nr:hypothetical protein [Chlorobiaceae bacterium]
MVELNARGDELVFRFPEVHPEAALRVSFRRTLRIPDDGKDYPLPPGLGNFPMRLVDDFSGNVPKPWMRDGGVMLPMYQAEALWVGFNTREVDDRAEYPFAIKISTGKVNAASGQRMRKGLNMEPQDYVVAPRQPWVDGYCVEKGVIRQFVAMPLGSGYSVEEQVTGSGEFGGMQVLVYPMKRSAFEKRFPKPEPMGRRYELSGPEDSPNVCYCLRPHSMGFAPGGRMRQEVYEDPYEPEEWDLENYSHCFVHIANSEVWGEITGKRPPYPPMTAVEYSRYGLPWFDYYAEEGAEAIDGAEKLKGLKSVKEMGEMKGDGPLPGNGTVERLRVREIGRKPRLVREGELESPKPVNFTHDYLKKFWDAL